MDHHIGPLFEDVRDQSKRAFLAMEFSILYASYIRDTGSAQRITAQHVQELGKTILEVTREATRDEDETSLRAKLFEFWTVIIINRTEVSTEKVQSLSRLVAGLVDLEKEAKGIIPELKKLSLRSDEIGELVATRSLVEIAGRIVGQLRVQDGGIWNFLPTEIWLTIFSFLDLPRLRHARLFCRKWRGFADSFLHLRFPYHGCDQNVAQFLQLAPITLPLEISSHWYSSSLCKDQRNANLDPLKQLKSVSLSLAWSFCVSCDKAPDFGYNHFESSIFWGICKFIEENKICLKRLSLAKHTQDSKSVKFLHMLAESFPIQYSSLEELTLTLIPESRDNTAFYKFIQSFQGLKRLRIGITSVQPLLDSLWEGLSYLQLRVQLMSRQDIEGFAKFFRRHRSLKKIVLHVERLQTNEEDDDQQEGGNQQDGDDGQEGNDRHEEGEEGRQRFIEEIQAVLKDIDHDVRIVDSNDRGWLT